jgi:predicted GNAT family acetyltransferase
MTVRDNPSENRFELTVEGQTAIAAYCREGDRIVFTHTIVPRELEGQGIGTRLIEGALAQVRGEGLTVVPQCAFVAAYLRKHPEAAEIAAA